MSESEDCVWALPITLDVCLCCGGVGGERVVGLDQGLDGWGGVCMSCESGLFLYMAGPGICILC